VACTTNRRLGPKAAWAASWSGWACISLIVTGVNLARPLGATDPIAEQRSLPEWSGQGWPEAITK
jgi:hypothetical protein